MRAVLIAATLAAIAAPAYAGLETGPFQPPTFAPKSFIGQPPPQKACGGLGLQLTATPPGVEFKRLDQLPWGLVEHAILRSVGGCPVREVVYQGRTYWVEPASPGTVGRIEPLIGQRETRAK